MNMQMSAELGKMERTGGGGGRGGGGGGGGCRVLPIQTESFRQVSKLLPLLPLAPPSHPRTWKQIITFSGVWRKFHLNFRSIQSEMI